MRLDWGLIVALVGCVILVLAVIYKIVLSA